jgi:hypothetical protein
MAVAKDADAQLDLATLPALAGNLPSTLNSGLIFLEYANIERKIGGVWTAVGTDVPSTFERVESVGRARLETWTHKPLFSVWLPPGASIADGDRLIRSDGTRWYVRGAPMSSPGNTHIVALVEASAEDGLFAARSAAEPS